MEHSTTASDIPIRVWLVEDETTYRETFAFLVDHASGMCCARTFADGEAACDALEATPVPDRPDVVLMDINLPGLSGIECTAQLKAHTPEVQVVMLTVYDDEEMIFDALRAGASGYLLKNAPVDRIIAAIREARNGGMLMAAPIARKVLGFFEQTPARSDYGLTARELEVLQQMVDGLTQKEIADRLFLSPSTVNGHVQHIYEKLHVHSGNAAVAKALRERLV